MDYLLRLSFEEQKPIKIIYQSKSGSITKRTIVVKSIDSPYISAYCFKRKNYRHFFVHNILATAL
ncbi:WYL domain-containing protein [Bacillus carboniphilus]|uniref:WYL domain-containing protein n=1 Tax=Bacillus carboniphilus TaxID=86663 RepID=UPI003FCE5939